MPEDTIMFLLFYAWLTMPCTNQLLPSDSYSQQSYFKCVMTLIKAVASVFGPRKHLVSSCDFKVPDLCPVTACSGEKAAANYWPVYFTEWSSEKEGLVTGANEEQFFPVFAFVISGSLSEDASF